MHLVNFPKIRIRQCPEGYIVEIEKRTWYGRKYWTHIESVSGMSSVPWYYQSFDAAVYQTENHFRWDLLLNSKNI